MLTVVHGNDTSSSRKYFVDQKNKNSITFDAENLNAIELTQSIQGSGLFETSSKIFIDNLFSKKGSKNIEIVAEVINKSKDVDIYIWADKEIGVKSLSAFSKFQNQNFKIPQSIWSFLDGIMPDKPSNVSLFHSAIVTNEPEVVFAMIIRQFPLIFCLF